MRALKAEPRMSKKAKILFEAFQRMVMPVLMFILLEVEMGFRTIS
jgi:hypothetical protein